MVQKIELLLQVFSGQRRVRLKMDRHPRTNEGTTLHTEVDGRHKEYHIDNSQGFDIEIYEDPDDPDESILSVKQE